MGITGIMSNQCFLSYSKILKNNMAKIFAKQEVGYADPVIFTTPGRYSMDAAIEILKRLENDEDYKTENSSMKSLIDGDLVEVGIPVRLGNIEFTIMCSYEDIFIKRISGNKMKFYEFCESIRAMDFSPRS
jgi:hypothetical protein